MQRFKSLNPVKEVTPGQSFRNARPVFFLTSEAHEVRLCASNAIERANQELKRRTRVASRLPNDASLPRFVTVLLSEISNEWATSKTYLNVNIANPPPT